MNISFITSGHEPFDDRIYFHMARSLSANGCFVNIISSKTDLIRVDGDIKIDSFNGDELSKRSKIAEFIKRLSGFRPDVIICSEPLTILAAKDYKKKESRKIRIIYDITEWYPSKKNLAAYKYVDRWLTFLKLLLFNYYVSFYADSFIFGEWHKSRPYRFLFPGRPFIYITYYPDLGYIRVSIPVLKPDHLKLSYSGKISREKGYPDFFKVLNALIRLRKDLKITVKIIGWYENNSDRSECEPIFKTIDTAVSLELFEKQEFKTYLEIIRETDIFIDLRSDDRENQHCLPIKIFYYAALGRPVIHTDLCAIRRAVDSKKFGFLVNPANHDTIAGLILQYLDNEELYHQHCHNARMLAEDKYNWKILEPTFIRFIKGSEFNT